MNLGEIGPGCPLCGRSEHEGQCLPPLPPLSRPDFYERERPKLSVKEKVGLWSLGVIAACIVFGLMLRYDKRERDQWRADWLRRTELCEANGGIPRYQVRGRGYDGCDFPTRSNVRGL